LIWLAIKVIASPDLIIGLGSGWRTARNNNSFYLDFRIDLAYKEFSIVQYHNWISRRISVLGLT